MHLPIPHGHCVACLQQERHSHGLGHRQPHCLQEHLCQQDCDWQRQRLRQRLGIGLGHSHSRRLSQRFLQLQPQRVSDGQRDGEQHCQRVHQQHCQRELLLLGH